MRLTVAKHLFTVAVVGAGLSAAPSVTFTKDVAPIIQKNCQVCHRAGEIGPMALTSYKEVRPWAKAIRQAVVQRNMPPWFADSKHGDFSNDARLSQKDIDTITAWVEADAPEGDPKAMSPNPSFIDGWNVGKPDVVLAMTTEYEIPAEGVISYKYFAVPTNFTEDRYVQFAEIRAGDRQHVHHVIVSVRFPGQGELPAAGEISPSARFGAGGGGRQGGGGEPTRPQAEGGSFAGRGGARSLEDSDGRLVGWAPGEAPLMLHPGQAKLVKKGSVLIFQVHYTTNGKPGKDRSSVGLIFSKVPVEKRVITAGAMARQLVIPAGEPNYESKGSFTFQEDSHIDSLHPHMHYRGKDFQYTLVYPDGTSKVLLEVPHYNFAWQLTYFEREAIAAPKGSRLDIVAHHDNSANNKFNPDPTKEVHWGEQTWDEMMIGYFDYTLDKQDLTKKPASTGGAIF
jgi:hypothetical protein